MNRFSFFLIALISTSFFLFRLKLIWLKNGGVKAFIVTCIFLRIITSLSSLKYKSEILVSVFLSVDQNLVKLGKRSQNLFNKFT